MMNQQLALIPSLLIAFLLMLGALFTLIGSFGLIRFKDFTDRIHAPTIGNTLGAGLVLLSSVLLSCYLAERVFFHEMVIIIFLFLTSPASAILLMRSFTLRHERNSHS